MSSDLMRLVVADAAPGPLATVAEVPTIGLQAQRPSPTARKAAESPALAQRPRPLGQKLGHAGPGRRLVSVDDAAGYLAVSRRQCWRLLESGRLRRVVLPGCRRVLLDVRDLDQLVEESKA